MEVIVHDIRISYEEHGSGLPVLLLHGFPFCGAMWQPQIDALAQHYRVIVPDLRGFGASGVSNTSPGIYTMEQHADDMMALLDALQIEQTVLVGLSMGGYIAFAVWRAYRHRVCGLVLCDTRATPDSAEARANRETTAAMVQAQDVGALADAMLPKLLHAATPQDRYDQLRAMMEATHPQTVVAALRGMAQRADSSDLLPTINVPTLVVVGETDVLSPPAEMVAMQHAIPGSTFVVLPNAGHVANSDQPTACNNALLAFLDAAFPSQ